MINPTEKDIGRKVAIFCKDVIHFGNLRRFTANFVYLDFGPGQQGFWEEADGCPFSHAVVDWADDL